jgi:hypothetical protein
VSRIHSTRHSAAYYGVSEVSRGYPGCKADWREHMKQRVSKAYSSFDYVTGLLGETWGLQLALALHRLGTC